MTSALQAVILAAGKGTRLLPFTRNCSKAMAPVVGKPIALRVMEQFMPYGIRDFIIVINPQDELIRPYFDKLAPSLGITITWVEQTQQKGMAHALLQAVDLIHSDFFLSACDNLVHDEVVPQMIAKLQPGTSSVLLLKPVTPEQVSSTGIIEFDGERILRIHEKPKPEEATSNISSLPMYLIRKEIVDYLPLVRASARGEYEIQDAMELMLPLGEMQGVMTDWRITLTSIDDLFRINQHYLMHESPAYIHPTASIAPSARLIPPYYIDRGVHVEEHATIGPNAYLGEDTSIGSQAIIQDSQVLQQASVPASKQILNQIYH